jgi:hypothetical protein
MEKLRTPDGGRLRFGPIDKLSPGSACEGSDPRMHQGGDDVVFDFSIRVWHAATSDGVEDASRWWTHSQERIVRLGSIAIRTQSLNAECAVRLREHGVQSLELSARAQTARQRQPDAPCGLSCLAQARRKLNMVAS